MASGHNNFEAHLLNRVGTHTVGNIVFIEKLRYGKIHEMESYVVLNSKGSFKRIGRILGIATVLLE